MIAPHFAKRSKPELPPDAPTLVTAFTCGGLFEIGAMYAGFRPVLGVEFYPAKGRKDDKVKQRQSAAAADNYERNFGQHIIRKSIEDAVRDRDFAHHVQQHGKPNAFHCSPSCTNLSQGNTKASEDNGDISAATAITEALEQLNFPEIFTLENVEAYQKSESWRIIQNFLYKHGYGVAADVVWASDYGNLETGEGVPQDRKRLIVRAVKGHFAPPLPPQVPKRMGWWDAIADLIDELPDGELAPWQLQRLPQLAKTFLVDAKNIHPGGKITIRESIEPAFTVVSDDRIRMRAYLVDGRNERSVCQSEQDAPTVTDWSRGVPSALLLNGDTRCGNRIAVEPAFTVTQQNSSCLAHSPTLLIERAGASDSRITTRTPEEPVWTLRSSIGTDQDGRNRNEVMNAFVGGRVKKLNARAIARLQSVPDWYTLPDQMKDAGPLIGNGVPSLLSEAIMRSLLPYVDRTQAEVRVNSSVTHAEPSLISQSVAIVSVTRSTPSSAITHPELSLNSPITKADGRRQMAGEGFTYLPSAPVPLPSFTCFVDAVGSGPCFGPVIACAVVLKEGGEEQLKAKGITDSKLLIKSTTSQNTRSRIWNDILPAVEHYAIAYATAAEINALGMGAANQLAMRRSVDRVRAEVTLSSVIVDGKEPIIGYEELSQPVPKADQLYPGVSAASCLAKIFRDSLITRLWGSLPYGLSSHKGYGTGLHKEALIKHGLHRQHHVNNEFVIRYGQERTGGAIARQTGNDQRTHQGQSLNERGTGRVDQHQPQRLVPLHSPTAGNQRGDSQGRGRSLETREETVVQSEAIRSSDRTQTELIPPFLKWAGGKTWAIALLQELYSPHRDRRFRDITLGSGAIPFALQPDRAYLTDKNPFLIQLWEWVKVDGKLTIDLSTDKDYYLECRDRFNACPTPELFYYLNHTCWRGLYRSSSKKFFSVPCGYYKNFHGQKDLSHYKQIIGHWEFGVESCDYALQHIQSDDFVVFDPPYHSDNGKGFTGYFGAFTEDDQIKSAEALAALDVPVVAFNANTDFILDLYQGLGFTTLIKEAPRMISSTGDRAPALEMVATKNMDKKRVHIGSFLDKRQSQPDDDQLTDAGVRSLPPDKEARSAMLTTNRCQSDLNYDEQCDRIHLERKVDSAFYEAGKALQELRDRKLYRSTHTSWEAYCQKRFGFSHQNGDKKIKAATVVDVLATNSCQILPSCVEQAVPLSKLPDEKKVEVWEDLTQDGKRPSGRQVKDVVAEICDRQAERGEYINPWRVGDVCQIHKKGDGTLAKLDGTWAIVSEVKTRQCIVKVWNGEVLVKAENLEELQVGEEILGVCDRVRSLMKRHMNGDITLKRGQLRFLEALGEQSEAFEPEDIEMLACIEAKASNHDASLVQATRLLVENAEYLTEDEARSLYNALRTTHEF